LSVTNGIHVTVALLVYRDPRWLEWCLENLARAKNRTTFDVMVVGNDANTRVGEWVRKRTFGPDATGDNLSVGGLSEDGHWQKLARYVDHRNPDPSAYAMARVYAAWNRCVAEARTKDVILVNTDMAFGDYWIDELLAVRDENPKCLPTSLLVESGRLTSGLPEYVMDFGRTPDTFRRAEFMDHARHRRDQTRHFDSFSGGLFMPVLWRKEDFEKIGGYWIQTPNHVLASDAVTFNKAAEKLGLEHRTAVRSVVYHVQEGETRNEE